MHLLLSLLPLIAFTVVESRAGVPAAVGASLLAALPALGWTWRQQGRLDRLTLGALVLAAGLGGMSVLSDDPRFVLWSPVVGNGVAIAVLMGLRWTGRDPIVAAVREAEPDTPLTDDEVAWLSGVGLRLVGVLSLHTLASAWSVGQSRETWLAVTGVGAWVALGGWVAAEAAWARFGPSHGSAPPSDQPEEPDAPDGPSR